MSNYGWTNEAGEPIMDGASWRFEHQLDLDNQADYDADHFYDNEPSEDYDTCVDEFCGGDVDPADGRCFDCGKDFEGKTPDHWGVDPMEDQWLDGSYEE